MPRWFLSYHSPDQSLAERLKGAIERKDPASSVFFAPSNLRAGGAWTAQLAQEIAAASAFILLIGEAGVGKWQVPEYDEALDRWVKSKPPFPLVVVLLEGQTAPGLPFLRQLHWIVTPDPASEKDIARIFDAASGIGGRPSELWRYASPYRGLEAMEEKDSDKAKLSDLIDATERRRAELDQPKPPAFCLYVDQGEELYTRAAEPDRRRFSQLLGGAPSDPRLRMMMSMRSDFYGSLQSDAPLFDAHRLVDVSPLGEDGLREVVSRPAQLLGARFESDRLVDIIARRAAEDSVKDVGALPLLSYTLDEMWSQMLKAGDGVLRLPAQSFELGGVLVERANRFLAEHPGAEDALRRVLTLKLATVREDGEPTRRRIGTRMARCSWASD